MNLHILDHIFFALLVLIFPVWDFFALRKTAARINAGRTDLRMRLYRRIIAEEWLATLVVVATWFLLGRTAGMLGLVPSGGLIALAGYSLTVVLCVMLILQAVSVAGSPEERAKMRKQFDWLSFVIPHEHAERRTFGVVSVTAGVCEEIVFRGYLTAYFVALFGIPLWAGALLSTAAFGMAHMYQGPAGMLKCAAVGGAMAVLYLMTGSLWAPMLAHAAIDLTSGYIGYVSFNEDDAPDNGSPELAA